MEEVEAPLLYAVQYLYGGPFGDDHVGYTFSVEYDSGDDFDPGEPATWGEPCIRIVTDTQEVSVPLRILEAALAALPIEDAE